MAVESTKKISGLAFEVSSAGFALLTDVKPNLGGENRGPDPHDFLQIALASCTAITLQMYAARKKIPLEYADVAVKITKEGLENVIQRNIKLIGTLSAEQKAQLLAIADKCPIHLFLTRGTKIESRLAENA